MAEIQVAVFTDAGTREHNEDACGYGAQDGRACFVVADGLGGMIREKWRHTLQWITSWNIFRK